MPIVGVLLIILFLLLLGLALYYAVLFVGALIVVALGGIFILLSREWSPADRKLVLGLLLLVVLPFVLLFLAKGILGPPG